MKKSSCLTALKTFLSGCIVELANERLQYDVWVKGKWEKWTSLDEVYMNFCDFCEPILESPNDYDISKEQLSEIKKLYDLIEKLDDENPHVATQEEYKALIDNPLWKEVRLQAKRVLHTFGESEVK